MDSPRPLLGLIVVIAAAANLVAPSFFLQTRRPPHVVPILILIAGLVAQPALLAIWAVFGTEPAAKRIARVLGILLLGWFAWMIGMAMAGGRIPAGPALIMAIISMGLMAFLAAALWLYRWRTKQGLCFGDSHEKTTSVVPIQFSVKQIFAWTTAIAVTLVLFRALFGFDIRSIGPTRGLPMVIAMGVLFSAEISVLTILCLEFCVGWRAKMIWFGIICACLIIFPMVVLAAVNVSARTRPSPSNTAEVFGLLFLFFSALSTFLILVLMLIRSVGFRLEPPPSRNDQVPMSNDEPQ